MKIPQFSKETDLCAAFLAAVPETWQAYAETGGHDILLSRKSDGCQIGIQAKLKLNATVLIQAAEDSWPCRDGPDYRAVLVPGDVNTELAGLAPHCALTVITMNIKQPYGIQAAFRPELPTQKQEWYRESWFELLPVRRHKLPEYVPDVMAGASAPIQLTEWKIAALKLCILIEATGFITRDDFKRFRIDIRRWISGRWIVATPAGYVKGPGFPDLKRQHPRVFEEISADHSKWRRPEILMVLP
jgi:hypothetical protein